MPCAPHRGETLRAMCNLYSITKGQQAIRGLAGAMRDLTADKNQSLEDRQHLNGHLRFWNLTRLGSASEGDLYFVAL
jgi:hypothetical protein